MKPAIKLICHILAIGALLYATAYENPHLKHS